MIGLQILPLSRIMPPMKRCLFLFPLLLLTACQPENTETPADPQAMYDKAQALLKPNVENGQSDFAGAMQWLLKAAALDDPFKLLPDFRSKGLTGGQVDKIFREKFGIYAEMTTAYGLLLMASWYNREEDFKRLKEALDYCRALPDAAEAVPLSVSLETKVLAADFPLSLLKQKKQKYIQLEKAEGFISGGMITAFPPCIPVVMPGEKIKKETIKTILSLQKKGAMVTGFMNGQIAVCCENEE